MDHIVPKAQNGITSWTNVVLSCIKCNDKKANKTPEQAGMRLRKKPCVPTIKEIQSRKSYKDVLMRKLGKNIPETWEQFLGEMYWNVGLKD
jgi:CRISPR/Cas system Type II protein with McrA/HNH and RuvC-like nuclease domain